MLHDKAPTRSLVIAPLATFSTIAIATSFDLITTQHSYAPAPIVSEFKSYIALI